MSDAEPPSVDVYSGWNRTPASNRIRFRSSGLTSNPSHTHYTSWQIRERTQQEEAAKLEAEQIKLFGGMPGDDVGLCYRMLEYFGGLDFIDT